MPRFVAFGSAVILGALLVIHVSGRAPDDAGCSPVDRVDPHVSARGTRLRNAAAVEIELLVDGFVRRYTQDPRADADGLPPQARSHVPLITTARSLSDRGGRPSGYFADLVTETAERFLPALSDLPELRAAARNCRGCELYSGSRARIPWDRMRQATSDIRRDGDDSPLGHPAHPRYSGSARRVRWTGGPTCELLPRPSPGCRDRLSHSPAGTDRTGIPRATQE